MRIAALGGVLALVACGHSQPFTPSPPDTVEGPFAQTLPRRLTFNPLADLTPSAIGDSIVFTRADANRDDGDACVAILPLEGGRLRGTLCQGGTTPDTARDTWLYPAVNATRSAVAFVHERRGGTVGNLVGRSPVVALLRAPDTVLIRVAGAYPLPAGGIGNGFHRLRWANDTTIWFLGGTETVGTSGGFVPGGVFAFSVAGDSQPEVRAIPELSDAAWYAVADDGSVFYLSIADGGVYRWTVGSPPMPEPPFDCLDGSTFGGITDVAVSGPFLVVIATCLYPDAGPRPQLLSRDLDGGPARSVTLPFEAQTITGVPGRGLLIVEGAGDLWLVEAR